jgi:hypothetical protein
MSLDHAQERRKEASFGKRKDYLRVKGSKTPWALKLTTVG